MKLAQRASIVVLGLALAAPLSMETATSATSEFYVDLDNVGAQNLVGPELVNEGTAPVQATVVSNEMSAARAVGRWETATRGFVRLPVSGTDTGPQAILRFIPSGTDDSLLPHRRPFVFGADVRLRGAPGTLADKGNNVLQRGRFGTDQYKLQVDRGRASCRVGGDRGAAMVQDSESGTSRALSRFVWYRLQCSIEREAVGSDMARLRLSVTSVASGARRDTTSSWTRIGSVAPSKNALEAGGVTPSRTRNNDQLEGDIDRLFVDVR